MSLHFPGRFDGQLTRARRMYREVTSRKDPGNVRADGGGGGV